MTINIECEAEEKLNFDFDYEETIKSVIEKSCDYVQCPYEAEVSVTLTDNDGIKQINKEFRNIDNPTDVLSFPLLDYETPADFKFLDGEDDEIVSEYFNPDSGELVLGDIIISVEKVKEQSEKFGHSDRRELAFLVAHSMMHLFGYDHMESDEAAVMEKKQAEVLDMLGISR
jgi:probable rRNA maturation factor